MVWSALPRGSICARTPPALGLLQSLLAPCWGHGPSAKEPQPRVPAAGGGAVPPHGELQEFGPVGCESAQGMVSAMPPASAPARLGQAATGAGRACPCPHPRPAHSRLGRGRHRAAALSLPWAAAQHRHFGTKPLISRDTSLGWHLWTAKSAQRSPALLCAHLGTWGRGGGGDRLSPFQAAAPRAEPWLWWPLDPMAATSSPCPACAPFAPSRDGAGQPGCGGPKTHTTSSLGRGGPVATGPRMPPLVPIPSSSAAPACGVPIPMAFPCTGDVGKGGATTPHCEHGPSTGPGCEVAFVGASCGLPASRQHPGLAEQLSGAPSPLCPAGDP